MMPVTTPHCRQVAALCFLWTLGRAEPSPSWWGGIAPGSERSWGLVCVWLGAPLSVSDSWLRPLQVSQQKVMPVPQEGWEPPSTNGTSNTVNEWARYLAVPFPWKKSVLCREPPSDWASHLLSHLNQFLLELKSLSTVRKWGVDPLSCSLKWLIKMSWRLSPLQKEPGWLSKASCS